MRPIFSPQRVTVFRIAVRELRILPDVSKWVTTAVSGKILSESIRDRCSSTAYVMLTKNSISNERGWALTD